MSDDRLSTSDVPRRSFLSRAMAALLGLAALATPVVAGVAVLLDPILKRNKEGEAKGNWIRVASLDQIPPDGKPHQFAVVDPAPTDKWNLYDPQPKRPVLLVRDSESSPPIALSSTCPHLGCIVGYSPELNQIVCPCHNAYFSNQGVQDDGSTVSPRNLDPLEVRVDKKTGDVSVNYQRFKEGIAERVVV